MILILCLGPVLCGCSSATRFRVLVTLKFYLVYTVLGHDFATVFALHYIACEISVKICRLLPGPSDSGAHCSCCLVLLAVCRAGRNSCWDLRLGWPPWSCSLQCRWHLVSGGPARDCCVLARKLNYI